MALDPKRSICAAGEEVMGATAAAIPNAFFDANAHNAFAAESFLDEIAAVTT
jgi:hypothetical protein